MRMIVQFTAMSMQYHAHPNFRAQVFGIQGKILEGARDAREKNRIHPFLMIPGQIGVDIFQQLQNRLDFPFKLYIMRKTLDELDNIIEKDIVNDEKNIF